MNRPTNDRKYPRWIKLGGSAALAIAITAIVSLFSCETKAVDLNNVISFTQGVEANKAVTVTTYGTYAPNLKVDGASRPFGFGIAAVYPLDGLSALEGNTLAEHTFVGLRGDYLAGDLFAGSVGGGLKAHFQLFGHDVVPFGIAGGLFPLSGSADRNVEIGTFFGGGAKTELFQFGKARADGSKPGSVGLMVAYERWSLYDTQIYHGGATLGWRF